MLACNVCVSFCKPDFLLANSSSASSGSRCLRVSRTSIYICRWEIRNNWEKKTKNKKTAASFSFLVKTGRAVPAAWESPTVGTLSLANGRQIPHRAAEMAWKRLKRDPFCVVSVAFYCSWQTQLWTVLMKTLKKHWMLMKPNNTVPWCSWHDIWLGGRLKGTYYLKILAMFI